MALAESLVDELAKLAVSGLVVGRCEEQVAQRYLGLGVVEVELVQDIELLVVLELGRCCAGAASGSGIVLLQGVSKGLLFLDEVGELAKSLQLPLVS